MKKSGMSIALVILFFAVVIVAGVMVRSKLAQVSSDGSNTDQSQTKTIYSDLKIIPERCTGCGKCIRFDTEHFSFNMTSRKAEVISNKNLDSENLKTAVSVCQTNAIVLK